MNTGCIPTKTLIASAYAAHMTRRAGDFGIDVNGPIAVDMKRVKARKDEISGKSRTGLETSLKNLANCTVYQGHARFQSPREITVGDALLSAEQIFINVGERARIPSLTGVDQITFWTNSSIMHVDFVPEHLLVVGGSYIGLEFAQMYRRFGSQVTVIEMSARLISREDEDVSAAIKTILEKEGIQVELNAECIGFSKSSGGISAKLDCSDGARTVTGSHVLLAVGRRPTQTTWT